MKRLAYILTVQLYNINWRIFPSTSAIIALWKKWRITLLDEGLLCRPADVTITSSAVTSRHNDDVLTRERQWNFTVGPRDVLRTRLDAVHDLVHQPLKVEMEV